MRIDIATLFPQMCETVMAESILGRAQKAGKLSVFCHQIRDYATDKHHRVDDTPYGGGKGMLLLAEPIFRCYEDVAQSCEQKPHVIYLSPKGTLLTQKKAVELSQKPSLFLLCGHYEGVDQRVLDTIVDEEISIGDYVLTGGELGALVLADAVARLCDGVLKEDICFQEESHYDGLLEYPHYTKPSTWNEQVVPEVLLSGHHANIEKWRREQALEITWRRRPDLLEQAVLSKQDKLFLEQLAQQSEE